MKNILIVVSIFVLMSCAHNEKRTPSNDGAIETMTNSLINKNWYCSLTEASAQQVPGPNFIWDFKKQGHIIKSVNRNMHYDGDINYTVAGLSEDASGFYTSRTTRDAGQVFMPQEMIDNKNFIVRIQYAADPHSALSLFTCKID